MSDCHDVSVIGLGAMGSGIARTFLARGCRVSVWNRSREKVDALVSSGAIACVSPQDALDANTHVVVCLSDYAVWQQLIEEHDLAGHVEGTCIIQLTTGTIDEVQSHAALIHTHGGRLTDGAVMCYPSNLGTDAASLLMSGASDVLDECDPILSMLDANWTNLGDDLNGPAILSRSLMAGMVASMMGLVNGAAICRAGGVSLDVFLKLNERSNGLMLAEKKRLVEAIRDGRTEETQASIKAWREGNQVFQKGRQAGLDEHDLSALVDVFDPNSG
jgi:3-hydroxyisobutyrate dehydrogenase-like beta-hydroxyacid dehydrogenase